MDAQRLRAALGSVILPLKDAVTHDGLPELCEQLGLPKPSPPPASKRDRLSDAFDAVADADLPQVAAQVLARRPPPAAVRNEIQDLLWGDAGFPVIPKRQRRELTRALDIEDLFRDGPRFMALLDALWVLDGDALDLWSMTPSTRSLRAKVDRHVLRNPGDWNVEQLFDALGAFEASDRRFALFLEGLTSSEVWPDEAGQRRLVEIVNSALRSCGVEMRESGQEDGYPTFALIATSAAPLGRVKQLIFASATKPDLRLRDSVTNDIEIVTHADRVLVYDRPIGAQGLRWADLQSWWAETQHIAVNADAKKSLYRRLRSSLPASSPPQRLLFDSFHRAFARAIPRLPALLPEVWLHWDPKTVRERGVLALARFRMDFLMLLPHGVRVVIEVDGQQHYAHNAHADAARYAAMVAADRELRLAGYEVFRFGAHELQGPEAAGRVKAFFAALFKQHHMGDL